jgi:hypothetical protein
MRKIQMLLFILTLISLSSCFVDIPNVRPDGPVTIVYGKVINNETKAPVSNAVISDGFSTTLTNSQGNYRFETAPGATHVFISVPERFEIPMKDGIPHIFERLNFDKDSVQVNFNLKPLAGGVENDFTLIAIADPQVQNSKNLSRLNNETIPDIIKTIEEYDNVYGLTLGDLAFDSLNLLNDVKQSFISTTIPVFHTIGNHDFSAAFYDPIVGSSEFVSHFGPLDFSFNRGNVHIVVMNNVFNYGVTSHKWGFSEEQINWLKSDLKHVPKDKMLIVSVHIPVLNSTTMERKSQFLDAISGYNEVHILSGHWHANRNIINSELNIYEHITGAASGMWWGSTVNKCGAPNGYGVYEISGNKMKNWYYKSVRYDKGYQIRMIFPNTLGDKDGYVIANVWNADDNWKVELVENDINQGQMERYTDYAPEVFSYNKSLKIAENTEWYMKTHNLYRLKPKNPNAEFSINATDKFGNIYIQNATITGLETLRKY